MEYRESTGQIHFDNEDEREIYDLSDPAPIADFWRRRQYFVTQCNRMEKWLAEAGHSIWDGAPSNPDFYDDTTRQMAVFRERIGTMDTVMEEVGRICSQEIDAMLLPPTGTDI